jgi:electron transfer flavoprotein alpha subunit
MSGVLVVVEQRDGALTRLSLEALAAGQRLAKQLSIDCSAVALGEGIEPTLGELSGMNLTKVFAVEHPLLQPHTAAGSVHALEQVMKQAAPGYVIFPHSYQVRDFAPALATRFGQVLIPDVIAVAFNPDRGGPSFVRQLFQGKLNADYRQVGDGPCFVSVQAGSINPDSVQTSDKPAPVELFTPVISPEQIRTKPSAPFREAAQTVDLTSAPVIVSVGRGIREQENIPLVQALADALGAELAASRPICDAGWLPMERQVGSSGQTVSPMLYLAVGISGAIQHLVGMKGSKTVIAINKDENAPIFEVADYGVAGDLFEVVPALTKAILAAKG